MKSNAEHLRGYLNIEDKFERKLKRINLKYATEMFSDTSGPAEIIYCVVAIYVITHIIFFLCSKAKVETGVEK